MEEMTSCLLAVAKKEGVTLAETTGRELARRADGDMRRAINDLQALATHAGGSRLDAVDAIPPLYPWQHEVRSCAQMMGNDLTVPCVARVRTKLLELLAGQLPAEMILSALVKELTLLPNLTDRIRVAIVEQAALTGHALHKISKDRAIFQLESFCVQVMALLEEYMRTEAGDSLD